jgi:hypothetical protein
MAGRAPSHPPIHIPEPDDIRAAVAATDEQARWLRRHLTTADQTSADCGTPNGMNEWRHCPPH